MPVNSLAIIPSARPGECKVERSRRRIVIDGSMATGGGGFTYLANILPELARMAPEDRFLVLVRTQGLADSLAPLPNLEVKLLPEAGLLQRLWFLCSDAPRLARSWGADLYYSAGEYIPFLVRCPVIASFQNANVFTTLQQGWPWRERFRLWTLRRLALVSAWRCDRILFVSRDSARWMGDAAGLPDHARAWLHHGINSSSWRSPGVRPDRLYVLSVSSIYRYKNFVRLIEAWTLLARRRADLPDLMIVGDNLDPPYADKMEAARRDAGDLAGRIHFLGGIPHADIGRYYQSAAVFVFPSYLESFGIPLIEAMASGSPVVATDLPVFREIAEDAALYVDPHSAESIAEAIEKVVYGEGTREKLAERGVQRARLFTWDRAASTLSALFDEVIAESGLRRSAPVRTPIER